MILLLAAVTGTASVAVMQAVPASAATVDVLRSAKQAEQA
jgi:hypothetical protein